MPHVTVEDLVAVLQQLPPEVSAVNAVSQGLWHLDSRAVAALLKVSLRALQRSNSWSWNLHPLCYSVGQARPEVFGKTYVHACTAMAMAIAGF